VRDCGDSGGSCVGRLGRRRSTNTAGLEATRHTIGWCGLVAVRALWRCLLQVDVRGVIVGGGVGVLLPAQILHGVRQVTLFWHAPYGVCSSRRLEVGVAAGRCFLVLGMRCWRRGESRARWRRGLAPGVLRRRRRAGREQNVCAGECGA
jgi:hypothetical protein